ncbi:MAG: UDP-3-O-(3-hydroxymyristoyl)glucosamine N-acyltransferase [Pseudomonadota bacterium]
MFFESQSVTLAALAQACGAELVNCKDADKQVSGAAPIEAAINGQVSFVDNPKYLKHLTDTGADAVFCSSKYAEKAPSSLPLLLHDQPYQAYAAALGLLYPTASRPLPVTGETGISSHAFVHKTATLEENVTIEAGACVGPRAAIGAGSVLLPGAVVGEGVHIGRNSTLGASSTVVHALVGDNVIIHNGVQIGQDGFGFAMGPQGHKKVPQIGRVIIQDRVEIGANSTVDRGANRDTVIGEGTKIDNLVQIGHNAVIGRHCVIVGLAGISGSATLGDFVVVAGQAGIVGHTKIGNGAQIGGGSGVHGDVAPGERVMGYPAVKASTWMRDAAKVMLADKRARKADKAGKKGNGS